MKFKRTIASGLALATFFSGTSIVSYADEASEAAMRQALTYVKERIDIPEELTEFDYSKRVRYGKTTYDFNWRTPDNKDNIYHYIDVSVRGKVIVSYSGYCRDKEPDFNPDDRYSFGKLSHDEIVEKMEYWIKKLNPSVYKDIELDEESLRISVSSDYASATIRRTSDGIPVMGQNGSIIINKNTGELIDYGLDWILGAGFPDYDDMISKSEAMDAFKEKMPTDLVYTATYDYKEEKYIPHLIYRQTDFSDIDALSGELTTFEGSYFNYYGGDADLEGDAEDDANPATGGNGVSFTEAELKKLELEGILMTAEEAVQMLVDMDMFWLGENPGVEYSYSYADVENDEYYMNLTIASKDKTYYITEDKETGEDIQKERTVTTTAYVGLNPKTGEIKSFSSSSAYPCEAKLSEANSKTFIKKYIGILAGEKAKEFKVDDVKLSYDKKNKDGTPAEDSRIIFASASSPRYVYDIPTMAESISININKAGKIIDYSINYLGIEYPEPEKIITRDEAVDKYFDQVEYYLQHRLAIKKDPDTSKDTVYTAVVYNADNELYIDAFTGKLTYSNGEEFIRVYKGGYTDLEGSKYKDIAEKLASYNITLMDENGRLNEDEYITRAEFAELMRYVGCWYYNSTGGDKALTRQFAAKILTNSVISEECAELPGIFKTPFSDVKETSKYLGYIAVANALGYMGGEDGKFYPSRKITRGEALEMLYERLA